MSGNTEDLSVRFGADGVGEFIAAGKQAGQGLEEVGTAADKASAALVRHELSAKQLRAAYRMLPAQMTDVVTSLASGMPVWLVAIQQGGQIKDSFGGAGNALRALGSYVTPTAVALGSLAAVAGALALAYNQGSREQDVFRLALVTTGNAAGTTTGQLADMARATAAATSGITQGQMASALAALVATGQVGVGNLRQFAQTAVQMEQLLGQSAAETARIFAELGRAPLEASVKLNQSTNHLTVAVYEQIRALTEQGRSAEAAAVAQRAYNDAMVSRAAEIQNNLGGIESAWAGVKRMAAGAWDAMLDIGRPMTLEQKLKEAQQVLEQARGFENGRLGSQLDKNTLLGDAQARVSATNRSMLLAAEGAATAAWQAQVTQAYIKAKDANQRWADAALSNTQKLNKALEDYRRNNQALVAGGAKLDPAQVAREEKAIRDSFATKPGAVAKPQADGYEGLNSQIERRLVLANAELAAGQQLSVGEQFRVEMLREIAAAEQKLGIVKAEVLRAGVEQTAQRMRETDAQRAAAREAEEAARSQREARAAELQGLQRQAEVLEQQRGTLANQTAEIGLNSQALFERRQRLLDNQIVDTQAALEVAQATAGYEAQTAALQRQLAALREIKALAGENYRKTTQAEEDKANAKRSEDLAQSIEQGLMSGFRQGLTVSQIFWRELQAQAARTVLTPAVKLTADLAGQAFSSGLSWLTKLFGFHSGGVGQQEASFTRQLPRFHTGVGPDEMAAVIQKSEGVFTRGQMKALAPVDQVAKAARQINLTYAPQISIDSRTDQAQVAALVQRQVRQGHAELLAMMDRNQV